MKEEVTISVMNEFELALQHPVNSEAWSHLFARVMSRPRRKLFHYTSIDGLYGILTSKELWATDAEFLNDPLETQYARSVIAEVWQETASALSAEVRESFELLFRTGRAALTESDVFVTSVCGLYEFVPAASAAATASAANIELPLPVKW